MAIHRHHIIAGAILCGIYGLPVGAEPSSPADLAPSTAICRTLVDRYRPLAHSHPGEAPIEVLAASPTSGVALVPESSKVYLWQTASDLAAWAAKQMPPVTISAGLAKAVQDFQDTGGGGYLKEAPREAFYSISRSQGSMGCNEIIFFLVSRGVASLAEGPPNTAMDNAGSCLGGFFATLDKVPLFVQEDYDLEPDVLARIEVSTWHVDRFAGACSAALSYAPLFNDRTIIDWPAFNHWQTCKGDDCENLHKTALRLAEAAYRDPASLARDSLAGLTQAERARYEMAKQLAVGATGADANAADITDSSQLISLVPLHVPYVDHGLVYVVSLGHFTIGMRPPYADWSVIFATMDGNKLVQKAAFAVGMWKGDLQSVAISSTIP